MLNGQKKHWMKKYENFKSAEQVYLEDGKIDLVTNQSGHYQPTVDNTVKATETFKSNNLTTSIVDVQDEAMPEHLKIGK